MVEYLYDAIRAASGQDIPVVAKITDEEGIIIAGGCTLTLSDGDSAIIKVSGAFDGEQWIFTIPADVTEGKRGRYWYCISHNDVDLCFYQPIYLI